MHKLVFYSTIVGVPACVNDAPSWTVLLWFTTDFRLYRHIVPRLIPFSSSTAIHSLALSLFPLPLSLLFLFFRIQKKFPFLKRKRITPTCVYQPVKFFISWGEDRVAELSEDVELVSGGHTSDTMFSSPLLSLACSSSSVHRGPSS